MTLRAYRPGDLVVCNIGTDYAATTRYAMVEPASQHGESLTLTDVTGKELTGPIVSIRGMLPEEIDAWHRYESEQAYAAAERAAKPDVIERVVMVLLVASRMRRVVTVRGEEIKEVA